VKEGGVEDAVNEPFNPQEDESRKGGTNELCKVSNLEILLKSRGGGSRKRSMVRVLNLRGGLMEWGGGGPETYSIVKE